MDLTTRFSALKWGATLQSVALGALGGFAAFFLSEPVGNFADFVSNPGFLALLWGSMLWAGVVGATIGAVLLVHDNTQSLRGAWWRHLAPGVALFFVLSLLSGGAGQIFYYLSQFVLSPGEGVTLAERIARALGWSFLGVGVGFGIGVLRRDLTQAWRGALGGCLGGFLGGFLFDALAQISTSGNGSLSRCIGLILMGAAIAFGRVLVQEALKTAWLLGISAGPYEGKEAPLTKNRVSVGRDQSCDIALLREESVTAQHGALVFEAGRWNWRGETAKIDGIATQNGVLRANSVIEFGALKFRFLDRSRQHSAPVSVSPSIAGLPGRLTPTIPAARPTNIPAVRLQLRSDNTALWPDLSIAEGKSEATVGRAPTNDFVLSEATVSSHHARIVWNSDGLHLRDENSSNGTRVNGEKIAPGSLVALREGDRVAFGKLGFRVAR